MKTTRFCSPLLLVAGILLFLAGCKKENKDNLIVSSAVTSDNAVAQASFDNAKVWSDIAMVNASLKSTQTDTVYMGTCVLATLDLATMPYKLVIDFGNSNCKCDDGLYRRGKIIVTFNGSYWVTNTVITYTFEDYFIDDHQVTGVKTVTNMGRNASNNLWWKVQVNGSVILPGNSGTIIWNSTREHEWAEGESTPFVWWDDVYLVSGTASGTGSNGKAYSGVITKDLKKKLNCEWLVSGTIDYQVEGLPLIVADYGEGTCDNIATATVNGQVYTIHMN